MRLWHVDLLEYLPDKQLKGQLREVIAIMHNWRKNGNPKSLIVNKVTEYPKTDLYHYFLAYCDVYKKRFNKDIKDIHKQDFEDFVKDEFVMRKNYRREPIFRGWHNKNYLRVCMANLYEKHFMAKGKTTLTDLEWNRLLEGYKELNGGEIYVL